MISIMNSPYPSLPKQMTANNAQKVFFLVCLASVFFFVSLLTRLTHFFENVTWSGDEARDIQVSYHLYKYKESLSIGPTASGFPIPEHPNRVLHYPTHHYRYYSIFWFLFRDFQLVLTMLTVVQSFSVVILFFIVYELTKKILPSAIAAWLFSVCVNFIESAREFWSVSAVTPMFLLSVFLLTIGFQRRMQKWIIFGYGVLLFAATIHYSLLVVVPFVYLLSLYRFRNINWAMRSALFLFVTFLVLNRETILFFSPQTFFEAFVPNLLHTASSSIDISKLLGITLNPLYSLRYGATEWVVILAFMYGVIFSLLNRRNQSGKVGILFLTFYLYTVLVTSIQVKLFQGHYVAFLLPLLIIFFAISLSQPFEKLIIRPFSPRLLSAFFSVVLFFLLSLSVSGNFVFFHRDYCGIDCGALFRAKEYSQSVLKNLNPRISYSFQMADISHEMWSTPTTGFYLEYLSGKRLFRLRNSGNNLKNYAVAPQLKIFACDLGMNERKRTQAYSQCLTYKDEFIQQNVGYTEVGGVTHSSGYLTYYFMRRARFVNP